MKRSFILMLIVPFLWALNFVFGKVLVDLLPPFTIAGGRFTVAGIIFGLWILLRKKRLPQTDFKFILNLFLIGLTSVVTYNGVLYMGLKHTTVVNGTIVNSFNPIAIMFLAFLILKEKVTWKQILGAVISIFGVAVIVSGGSLSALTKFNIGDIIIFLNTFVWALFSVLGKKAMKVMSPLETIAFTTCMGLPLLWLVCGVELHYSPVESLSLSTVLLVIFLGVFASVLAFVWWYQGIRDFGASGAAAFYNLIPLYSLILSAVFLGEDIHMYHILGCLLILGGVFISSQSLNKQPVSEG
ncbi:MAG: DMT family transporter [Syntrophomonadaceae bacterium]|jgi:drug/metabolite transporter (DMT)-like permease|nr:DMT family transporter [Syntrophomonadaceae bacterium]